MSDFCPYEILSIEQNAQDSEIKKAYRSLSKKYHPDKVGNDPELSKEFTKITSAKDDQLSVDDVITIVSKQFNIDLTVTVSKAA